MKITGIKVVDFKRIELVELTDLGDVVAISGENAAGKSSLIDAAWSTIAGSKGAKVTKPVRDGAKKATAVVEISDDEGGTIVVTKEWKGERSVLSVKAKGSKASWSKPQDALDALFGKFSFDPLAFALMKPPAQLEALTDLVELPFDLEANEAAEKSAYDSRTATNRILKARQGALEDFGDAEPSATIDVSSLSSQLRDAELVEMKLADLLTRHASVRENIARLERALAEEKDRLEEIKMQGGRLRVDALTAEQIASLRAQVDSAAELNAAAARYQRRQELVSEVEGYAAESESFTAEIERLKAERAEGLAAAKFPVAGLSFDEDGVIYKGQPFSQASQAEKILVSMSIAMAINPDLKSIFIKDANVVSEKNLKIVYDLAEKKGYQLFVELVDKDDVADVVIEEGRVRA